MTFAKTLTKTLKEKRNIADSSIKMYLIHLKKTSQFLNKTDTFKNLEFLKQTTRIVDDFFKNKTDVFKRNYTATYLSVLGTNKNKYESLIEFYQTQIKKVSKTYIR